MATLLLPFLLLPVAALAASSESVCYGTTGKGRLENGVKLPGSGSNFASYSSLGNLLGRTYLHSQVREVVLTSYKELEKSHPGTLFMYGETGKKKGGKFSPHKTHQNGLSVDFMVSVTKGGKSVYLPTGIFNKFGYNIEFDRRGRYGDYAIDFEAIAAHLVELHKASLGKGIAIWRVIFDPQLQPLLFATEHGDYLQQNLQFSKKRSWVRHDDHYHVDFKAKCKPL